MAKLTDILKATNTKLKNVKREEESLSEQLERLGESKENLCNIREALVGLNETRRKKAKDRKYDPGRNDTAYFYCRSIGEEDIKHSNIPKLYEKCSECGERSPVLMSYEQIEDSSERDSWTKIAFSVCICGNYHKIKEVTKTERFL